MPSGGEGTECDCMAFVLVLKGLDYVAVQRSLLDLAKAGVPDSFRVTKLGNTFSRLQSLIEKDLATAESAVVERCRPYRR